ncbi:MAG: hypothetical protein R3B47_09695 [Bacteroidia bacterium]
MIRSAPDGGTVAMPASATTRYTCPGDGNPDVVSFMHSTTSAAQYAYVITDDQNNILGLPPGNMQDFEGAPAGICRVWEAELYRLADSHGRSKCRNSLIVK